jgi:uncharacterized protein (DUF362 family)
MELRRPVSRRLFLRVCALGAGSLAVLAGSGSARQAAVEPTATPSTPSPPPAGVSRVALIHTTDRSLGVQRAIDLVSPEGLQGSRVYFKPNFNAPYPTPCVTHADTLRAVAAGVLDRGASTVTIAERSGWGNDTRAVADSAGATLVAQELGLELVDLNELDDAQWTKFYPPDSHWQDGISVARLLLDADAVVQTCNLKTHASGGHFTLSLKNAVGLLPLVQPGGSHNYMAEMHGSPFHRSMIAEINTVYTPALVVIDGVQAFVDGGPNEGTVVDAGVILAGMDRVALDAVGVAILRHLGTTPEVSTGPVFEQEQIKRAAELGLGATSPAQIEIVTDDAESAAYAATIRAVLDEAPATTTPTATSAPTSTPPAGLRGDVNLDGDVNSIDASLILQYEAGLLPTLPP